MILSKNILRPIAFIIIVTDDFLFYCIYHANNVIGFEEYVVINDKRAIESSS